MHREGDFAQTGEVGSIVITPAAEEDIPRLAWWPGQQSPHPEGPICSRARTWPPTSLPLAKEVAPWEPNLAELHAPGTHARARSHLLPPTDLFLNLPLGSSNVSGMHLPERLVPHQRLRERVNSCLPWEHSRLLDCKGDAVSPPP